MPTLSNKLGVKVTVSDEKAQKMRVMGWVDAEAAPTKRGPGRPRKVKEVDDGGSGDTGGRSSGPRSTPFGN